MDTQIIISILLCSALSAVHSVPDGFILDVTPTCSTDTGTAATVTITSDLFVKITAKCDEWDVDGGEIKDNDVIKTVDIKYTGKPGADDGSCYFKNPVANSGLYWIDLELGWGVDEHTTGVQTEIVRITCTLEESASEETSDSDLKESPFSPEEIQSNMGSTLAPGTVTVDLVDVLGNDLSNLNIPMGKKVQLKASITGKAGLTPVSCEVITTADSYTVLTGGCGDGVVFSRTTGFTTSGTDVTSPFFGFFQLGSETSLKFECNFTACASACNGDSCVLTTTTVATSPARRKRSADGEPSGVTLSVEGDPSLRRMGMLIASTPKYQCKATEHQRKLSKESGRMEVIEAQLSDKFDLTIKVLVILSVVGTLVIISLLISLYVCNRLERQRHAHHHNGKPCYCHLNKPL